MIKTTITDFEKVQIHQKFLKKKNFFVELLSKIELRHFVYFGLICNFLGSTKHLWNRWHFESRQQHLP
jgi:hypothetical protein